MKPQGSFICLAVLTLLMPWLILFIGRGVFILCLFWLLVLSLLVSSIVMFRKSPQLAVTGFAALLLTLVSMLIVPSFARGD
jgi:hypothetical protein